jgi:two-component system, OmpR family, sensor histidine kinase ArlS
MLTVFFSTLCTLLVMNLFIIVLIFYLKILHIEQEINHFQKLIPLTSSEHEIKLPDYFTLSVETKLSSTFFTNLFFRPSVLKNAVSRVFIIETAFSWSLLNRLDQLTYSAGVLVGSSYYLFNYDLAQDIHRFWSLFRWILGLQGIVLVLSLMRFGERLKYYLLPSQQLAQSTKRLKSDVNQLAVSKNTQQIQSIAEAIEKIDAKKLDHPLIIEASQKELQLLTSAINEMLERINQTVSVQTQFVSDASHELRTPIAIIQGNINLIDRWGKQDPKILQESIDTIKSEVENMKQLVEHLLFLARGDSDTIPLVTESFDAQAVIAESVNDMRFISPERIFEYHGDNEIIINADKTLFKQALRILIDNSLKYSPENSSVKITYSKTQHYHVFALSDQGMGIQAQNIERMFDRFYRDDSARTRMVKGSGLGLAIVKWILDKHSGYVEIISREHIGTKVSLMYPIQISSK